MAKGFKLTKSELKLTQNRKYTAEASGRFSPRITVKADITNAKRLVSKVDEALMAGMAEVAAVLDDALIDAIRSKWPNGDDIVETGNLLDSSSVVLSGNTIEVINTAPYAKLIHFGGYIAPYGNPFAERVYIPPRPWVTAALEGSSGQPGIDLAAIYEAAFRKVFR